MNNIKNSVFHTVGTNANSYVKRIKKYSNGSKMEIQEKTNDNFNIYVDGQLMDEFKSKSTFNQFINSLIAYGMVEPITGTYKVVNNDLNLKQFWLNVFKKNNDRNINIIKQSRILSLLSLMNILNDKNFHEFSILGPKGPTKLKNILKEASNFEKETIKNIELLSWVLSEVKKYEFITK